MTQVQPTAPRTEEAIEATLREHGLPGEADDFRAALHAAPDAASRQRVIHDWRGRAHLRAHPPTEHERDLLAQAFSGDFSNFSEH